jgi:hypothetical protein
MPDKSGSQYRMSTRASNKEAHPGNAVKSKMRRTTAEVQQERAAKAQAKAAQDEVKRQNIDRTAQFEYTDMANEAMADATPRPPPKLGPASSYHQNVNSPLTGMSEDDTVDGDSSALFEQPEITSDNEQEQVSNSEASPPVQKWKTGLKATDQQIRSIATQKRKQMVEETVSASEEAEPQPQPKKVKKEVVKVRDVINATVNKLEGTKTTVNKLEGDKTQVYGDKMKSTLSEQTGGKGKGRLASRPLLQDQTMGVMGRPLRREGAVADINALYQQTAQTNNYQSFKRSQQNNNDNLMDDNNR